jgi:hypothetical protein
MAGYLVPIQLHAESRPLAQKYAAVLHLEPAVLHFVEPGPMSVMLEYQKVLNDSGRTHVRRQRHGAVGIVRRHLNVSCPGHGGNPYRFADASVMTKMGLNHVHGFLFSEIPETRQRVSCLSAAASVPSALLEVQVVEENPGKVAQNARHDVLGHGWAVLEHVRHSASRRKFIDIRVHDPGSRKG